MPYSNSNSKKECALLLELEDGKREKKKKENISSSVVYWKSPPYIRNLDVPPGKHDK